MFVWQGFYFKIHLTENHLHMCRARTLLPNESQHSCAARTAATQRREIGDEICSAGLSLWRRARLMRLKSRVFARRAPSWPPRRKHIAPQQPGEEHRFGSLVSLVFARVSFYTRDFSRTSLVYTLYYSMFGISK